MTTTGESKSIPGFFRKGWNRDDGYALVFMLLLLPVLITAGVFVSDVVQAVTSADFSIGDSLDLGVRAANHQVNERSQAEGQVQIDVDRAHEEFRKILADNLRLNSGNMAPKDNSPLAEPPHYILIVYNGDNIYPGCPSVRKYIFDGSALTTNDIMVSGFPADFRVGENDVDLGSGGMASVSLEHPGCVAWMKAKARKALGKEEIEAARWIAAEIHYW